MAKTRETFALDLTNQKFGRWTVAGKAYLGKGGEVYWWCQCECGTKRPVLAATLKNARSQSCGCLKRDKLRTHGKSRTTIYETWHSMIKRCEDPNNAQYANYGGRGISVCERWQKFENFFADMGEKPDKMSLDRYPNNNGNYEPSNCRWATQTQQIRNKRNTARVLYEGKEIALAELCEIKGLKLRRIRQRLASGMPLAKALMPGRHNRWDD